MSTLDASTDTYAERRARLFAALDGLPAVAVAFSGGVDSSVLLHAAHARLGARAIGVIADSASLPRAELEAARDVARAIGVELVELATEELSDPRYQENAGDRCYFCKHALFTGLDELCRARGIAFQAFGEIADDLALLRHGSRAAREFGVLAPLSQAGFTKADVRRYAAENRIASADKPASACLASRLPTGTRVTRERLARIERAESSLRELGFRVLRVRDHEPLARVEVGAEELIRARGLEAEITARLLGLGFERVELDSYSAPRATYGVR
ncbi:MAG TPA: ATP-dependent sacrificial sulfur transferase LarE [Planctomycetota bacterium]|nr:ATP-dependent sacrificial sulfur transferase LarE [Planctomycetota bacterium]